MSFSLAKAAKIISIYAPIGDFATFARTLYTETYRAIPLNTVGNIPPFL